MAAGFQMVFRRVSVVLDYFSGDLGANHACQHIRSPVLVLVLDYFSSTNTILELVPILVLVLVFLG